MELTEKQILESLILKHLSPEQVKLLHLDMPSATEAMLSLIRYARHVGFNEGYTDKHAPEVWVLTSEFNDYDQHGEYFEAAWPYKPTLEELKSRLGNDVSEAELAYIYAGGGRHSDEYHWFSFYKFER